MAEVEFTYKGISISIQCIMNEKMIEICKKYAIKIGKDINNIFFIYNGKQIKEELSFKE